MTAPLVVVEVLSPLSRARDAGAKLADYVRLPSVRHYLLVDTKTRAVVQHWIGGDGRIETRILRDGILDLDLPGLRVAVAEFFC